MVKSKASSNPNKKRYPNGIGNVRYVSKFLILTGLSEVKLGLILLAGLQLSDKQLLL